MSATDAGTVTPPARAGRVHAHDTIVKRSRGKESHEDHGGTWKVAFADFCLALMCLFLVLWLMAARQGEALRLQTQGSPVLEGGSSILESGSSENGKIPYESGEILDSQVREAPHEQQAQSQRQGEQEQGRHDYETPQDLKRLAERLRQASERVGLEENLGVQLNDAGLRVMLHDTDKSGVFQLGGTVPNPAFRDLIVQLGALFAGVGNPILVVGHTDARPYHSLLPGSRSNWHLSSDRALAARTLLLDGGMPASTVLQTIGMADEAPLTPEDPNAAVNRRIEFLVLSKEHAAALRKMFGVPGKLYPVFKGVNAEGRLPGVDLPPKSATVSR